jgi:hypothetical protein
MDVKDLAQSAMILRESTHFVGHAELAPLIDKQSIFLVLAGKKPVSEATSSRWIETERGAYAEPDDVHELQAFLDSLGLASYIRTGEFSTNALVSFDPANLDAYLVAEKTDNAIAIGRLFGYPQTAAEAFIHDASLDMEQQDALLEAAGIPLMMPTFRFSVAHAQQELAVQEDWYRTLAQYDLV